ncbi:MAG: O-antigen ligase family protein [Opitutales bacterium]|nr:O-antigen ligase family protein [Opitutales bacterium]
MRRELAERYLSTSRRFSLFFFALALVFCVLGAASGGTELFFYAFASLGCSALLQGFYLLRLFNHGVRHYWFGLLIFLPWMIYLFAENFYGNAPWSVSFVFCQNLFVFAAFFITTQSSRTDDSQFRLLSTMTLVSVAAVTMGIVYRIFGTGESEGARNAIHGFFASAEQISLFSLFVFFASFVLVLYPRTNTALRLLGIYTAIFAAAVIFIAGTTGGVLGFFAGSLILSLFFIWKKILRILAISVCVAGLAFAPLMTHFDAPLFGGGKDSVARHFGGEQSLSREDLAFPSAALRMWADHPVLGAGTGTFAENYSNSLPEGLNVKESTATCGSLPLQILAENGLLGFLLLAVPVFGLWFSSLFKINGSKLFDDSEDARAFEMRQRPLASFRVLMTASSAGLAAGTVFLLVAYEKSLPALFLPFAIFAGILVRNVWQPRAVKRRALSRLEKIWRWVLAVAVPVALVFAVYPVIESAVQTRRADRLLQPYCQQIGVSETAPATDADLLEAMRLYRRALAFDSGNIPAWQGLTNAALLICNYRPQELAVYLDLVRRCSDEEMKIAPHNARVLWQKGLSLVLTGKKEAARDYLLRAQEISPNNAALLMNLGEAWRKISVESPQAKEIYRALSERFPGDERIGSIFSGLLLVMPDHGETTTETFNFDL